MRDQEVVDDPCLCALSPPRELCTRSGDRERIAEVVTFAERGEDEPGPWQAVLQVFDIAPWRDATLLEQPADVKDLFLGDIVLSTGGDPRESRKRASNSTI